MTTNEMRELDAWIAVNLFGFVRLDLKPHRTDNRQIDGAIYSPKGCPFDCGQSSVVPYYTHSEAPAMQVLEKCCEKVAASIEHCTNQFGKRQWMISRLYCAPDNRLKEDYCKCAETLPLAICLFAKAIFS